MKKGKKRLLTGLLCVLLFASNIASAEIQVRAGELEIRQQDSVEDETVVVEIDSDTQEIEESEYDDTEASDSQDEEMQEEETEEENPVQEAGEEKDDIESTGAEIDGQEDIESEMENLETVQTLISSEDDIASGSCGDITWKIDGSGKLTVEGNGDFSSSYSKNRAPWYENRGDVISAEINVTGMTDARAMFYGCENMTSIDVSSFDTSKVKNMSDMFHDCSSLTSLDLSKFDTSRVKHMGDMFYNCSSLTSLDLSSFDTSNVTSMSNMFCNCSSLLSLDLSKFDTSNVTFMMDMFCNCSSLLSLNLSKFDTSNVTFMVDMFYECNSLTSLDLSKFDTSKVTNMSYMFYHCSSLSSLDLSKFDTSHVTNMRGMFCGCSNLPSLDLSKFDTSNVQDMVDMFNGCSSLTSLDLSSFDTNNVMFMVNMFYNCSSLTSLDLSSFNTSNVTAMGGMFGICSSLTSLDLSKFDTSNVTHMGAMFFNCRSLMSLDVSKFDTSNVTDMSYMFHVCRSLISLDVSNFDTSKVQNMGYMFHDCSSLPSLDVSKFDTSNVTHMTGMFEGCSSLPSLDLSSFDTSNVIIMSWMFEDCSSLTSLDLSSFNTSNVTAMWHLFAGCSSLFSLDLSRFDMSKMEDVEGMFQNCSKLSEIYTPYNLTVSVVLPVEAETDIWSKPDGTELTELPRNLSYSIVITKVPVIITPHILADKTKTTYECGDTLNTDDLVVYYYDSRGTVTEVTDYDTNANEIDMSTPGTQNLVITYNDLTATVELTVTEKSTSGGDEEPEKKTGYTVTFDLVGHGVEITPLTGIEAGSLIKAPETPIAEGYIFKGWYQDRACTKVWSFSMDTVQSDITLYACWLTAAAETDAEVINLCIQEIQNQTYTGSALKPSVIVYAGDGTTLLKAGRDYTIKYYNNIEADKAEEKSLGGSSVTGQEDKTGNGFTKDLAHVIITGKGNYTGVIYQNFHIDAVSISDRGGNLASGFTLKYKEQLVTSGSKAQKPFTSIKYKKSMKEGTDYEVKLTALAAYDAEGNALAKDSLIGESGGQNIIPAIPAGYNGTFLLTVAGKDNGNYTGKISKTIYVTDKNHLMKNAAITLGKNLKTIEYTGKNITLTPAYYDVEAKKYYAVGSNGIEDRKTELDGKDVFTVKFGKTYLRYGKDFSVSYTNHRSVGTVTMTIKGEGVYTGSKSVTFRIKGTAFNQNNISLDSDSFQTSMPYTGKALTQNHVILKAVTGIKAVANAQDGSSNKLVYGKDYTISYKNNLKKGKATMTFTAKPESGYSGSFKKTFQITAAPLEQAVTVSAVADSSEEYEEDNIKKDSITYKDDGSVIFEGLVDYTREGAKLTGRVQLINKTTSAILKEGIDYTVSYVNNKTVTDNTAGYANSKTVTGNSSLDALPTMRITGKGSYAGTLNVRFKIIEAAMKGNKNLTVSAAVTAYNEKKEDNYQYQPRIKVADGKKTLSAQNDYEVRYENCTQEKVTAYLKALEALAAGKAEMTAEALEDMRPYAVITAKKGSGYQEGDSITADLNIYQTKLTGSTLYVVVSENAAQTTYTGGRVTPEVTVYYGTSKAVKAAKNTKETKEDVLTNPSGEYGLTKLKPYTAADRMGNYTLTYGTNVTAGKNKGSVTVSGMGLYGGSVTAKFTIHSKNVYTAK